MLKKPVLHYFDGRGRAEIIRLTMAAAGIKWTEVHLKEAADFTKLKQEKKLLFGQLPLLQIDGKNLVQSGSIARYLAHKAKLFGDSQDDMVRIDMLFEGTRDFRNAFAVYGFQGYQTVLQKARNKEVKRYLPIYENVLKENGSNGFLVGRRESLADVGFLEILFWIEPLLNDELKPYDEIKKFLNNLKNNPGISKYLNSPLRARLNDDTYVNDVNRILQG